MLILKADYDLLLEVPCWQQSAGKNWCAVISRDSKSPGGLGREFWKQQPGERGYYRIPDDTKAGTPLEFGADQVGCFASQLRPLGWPAGPSPTARTKPSEFVTFRGGSNYRRS